MLGLLAPLVMQLLGGTYVSPAAPCPMLRLELADDGVTLRLRERGLALRLADDPVELQLADDHARLRLRC